MMKFLGLGLASLIWVTSAFAGPVEKFDYPELTMVPRSSDRLQSEADSEASRRWTTYLPVQISAFSTLAAGIATYDANQPGQALLGMGVGASWLILTMVMAPNYQPYTSGWERVKAMPRGTVREQLAYERAAEHEIHATAAAGERLRWLSILTNLGANAVMLAKGAPGGFGVSQGFQVGSALLALAPLLYPFHWREVCSEQFEYKKRIYGPVARPTFLYDEAAGKLAPGLVVSLRF